MPTMTTATTTRDDLADYLESEGFVIGKPAHIHPDAIAIDRVHAALAQFEQSVRAGHSSMGMAIGQVAGKGRAYQCRHER